MVCGAGEEVRVNNDEMDYATYLAVHGSRKATDDHLVIGPDRTIEIDVLENDTGESGSIDPTTVVFTSFPSHGTASIDPTTGRITYTPDLGFLGEDSFEYSVLNNLNNASNAATVTICERTTGGGDDFVAAVAGFPVNIDVLANDSDDQENWTIQV